MIITKFLFLLSVFLLLAGCFIPATPCNPPGHVNYGVSCHYKLEILDIIDLDSSQSKKVIVKVPQDVLARNKAEDPNDKERKYDNYPEHSYAIIVDNTKELIRGDVVEFHKRADDMRWGRLEHGKGIPD